MVFDRCTRVYVPIMYTLMTGKSFEMYWHALHWVIVCSYWRCEPSTVTCDFEKGLIKAVGEQFPKSKINGCLFHWKQAIRRKMLKLKIDKEYVSMAMYINVLDVLTIIPKNEIITKGIQYVREILESEDLNLSRDDLNKWHLFWEYFLSFWCSDNNWISSWNIVNEDGEFWEIQNRTNNALERYNRKMNKIFGLPHPSVALFIENIEIESRRQVIRLDDIRHECVHVGEDREATINSIPHVYTTFVPPTDMIGNV